MVYNISVKPGAEDDIDVAYNWYEEQKEGLGDEFLKELVEYYKKLESHPTAFHNENRSGNICCISHQQKP